MAMTRTDYGYKRQVKDTEDDDTGNDLEKIDRTKKGNKCTEQGPDPPVLVGVESGRTGSPRPSANDCPAPQVVNQTSGAKTATGYELKTTERNLNQFARRNSLARSPVRQRTSSTNSVESGKDKDEGKTGMAGLLVRSNSLTKRKRTESPKQWEDELETLKVAMDKLVNSSKLLQELVGKNSNTKVEIKSKIKSMSRVIEVVHQKMQEWDTYPRKESAVTKPTTKTTRATQTDKERKIPSEDKGTEVESEDLTGEILSAIENGKSFEDLTTVIDRRWPEEVPGHNSGSRKSNQAHEHDLE